MISVSSASRRGSAPRPPARGSAGRSGDRTPAASSRLRMAPLAIERVQRRVARIGDQREIASTGLPRAQVRTSLRAQRHAAVALDVGELKDIFVDEALARERASERHHLAARSRPRDSSAASSSSVRAQASSRSSPCIADRRRLQHAMQQFVLRQQGMQGRSASDADVVANASIAADGRPDRRLPFDQRERGADELDRTGPAFARARASAARETPARPESRSRARRTGRTARASPACPAPQARATPRRAPR